MEDRLTYDGTIFLFVIEIPQELCRAQLYGRRLADGNFQTFGVAWFNASHLQPPCQYNAQRIKTPLPVPIALIIICLDTTTDTQ